MPIPSIIFANPATFSIIFSMILLYFASSSQPHLFEQWLFSSYEIRKNKQWQRIITVAFVHAGLIHLLMNGLALYYFGPVVEMIFGHTATLFLFLFSVIGGSLFSLWVRRADSNYLAVGASGGVSGLLMVAMIYMPHIGVGLMLIPIAIPAWIFGIVFSIMSIVLTQTPDRHRISHEGHLGGMLFGGMIAYLTIPAEVVLPEQKYLFYFGVLPIALFVALQTAFPAWFYRKN